MKRRYVIRKILLGGTALALFLTTLNSCSKEQQKSEEKELTIDMADPAYSVLTSYHGTVIVNGSIIVANVSEGPLTHIAANISCPSCGGTIALLIDNTDPNWYSSYWKCTNCKSYFNEMGSVQAGTSILSLKTYPVSKSGNILTVHNL
jgi:hypothetical protein